MRGEVDPQAHLFAYFSPDARVPPDHPLRSIKAYAEAALSRIDAELEALYGATGRPSIPPKSGGDGPAWSTSVASGARTTRTRAAPIPRRS